MAPKIAFPHLCNLWVTEMLKYVFYLRWHISAQAMEISVYYYDTDIADTVLKCFSLHFSRSITQTKTTKVKAVSGFSYLIGLRFWIVEEMVGRPASLTLIKPVGGAPSNRLYFCQLASWLQTLSITYVDTSKIWAMSSFYSDTKSGYEEQQLFPDCLCCRILKCYTKGFMV